ncbi:oryzin precursor [Dendryphion nanum]|uniref:Oryzin n=1 Tax=Dendryphion nanum TaxID=256645 RepID=A0A9P9DS36_9PLEO|nr:oryzin precursor [Dendryphion nanum]
MKYSATTAAFLASLSVVTAARDAGYLGKVKKFDVTKYADKFGSVKTQSACIAQNDTTFIALYDPYDGIDDPFETAMKSLTAAYGNKVTQGIETGQNSQFAYAIIPGNCSNQINRALVSEIVDVAVVEDAVNIESFLAKKTGTPWGLQRISNEAGATGSPQGQDFTYSFEDENLGKGVDIYVVDTGVRTSHAVFTGRATEGFSFTGSAADGDGHGTHVAGTAGGAKFGVAQGANIIAVKVLGDDGSGSSADTIAGMSWIINNHNKRKTQPGFIGSIMSMSWGLQGTAATVDRVILSAVDAGIHVSVAAGNDGADACGSTPSHNGGANSAVVTVGSVNIQNKVSSFSNIGTCVDIYAPGEQILSAWNTGDNIINFLSGTSMACPHTSGVMAYLMAQDPAALGQNPAALKAKLLATARKDKFTGQIAGSANLLLSNGVDGGVTARRLVKNYVVPDQGTDKLSPVLGGPTSWAKHLVENLGKRWELHSSEAQMRY